MSPPMRPRAAEFGSCASSDRIRLSVARRTGVLLVNEETELERRGGGDDVLAKGAAKRGCARLYDGRIAQADEGCDFRFLRPGAS